MKPSTPATRSRGSGRARWRGGSSAHSVRLNDFIGRPASWLVALRARRRAARRAVPGAIFCTPAVTTSSPAGGPETSTSSLRYPCTATRTSSTVPTGSLAARCTTHSAGCPLLCVIAAAGIAATGVPRPRRARRPAWRSRRAAAAAGVAGFRRARYVRVCARGLRRQLAQDDLELLVGRARERRPEARRLERREVVLGHVDDDLGLALVRDRDDRLALGDDLADLEAHGRHDAAARRAQHGVLAAGCARVRACRAWASAAACAVCARALRVLVVGRADRAVGLQRLAGAGDPIRPAAPARSPRSSCCRAASSASR